MTGDARVGVSGTAVTIFTTTTAAKREKNMSRGADRRGLELGVDRATAFPGGRTTFLRVDMRGIRRARTAVACLIASASLLACTRAPESTSSGSVGRAGSTVGEDVKEDVKGVAKASEKAAKDIGQATVDLGDKARNSLEDATNKAGGEGQAAWITTKVKSELTRVGLDPLHVHVDTTGQIVTLSGTVESAADLRKAVSAAKDVKGVLGVQDHLYVKPAQR